MNREVSYTISMALHWKKLKSKEELVDISDNSYFGIRAMAKKAIAIIYDPTLIDNLVKICSEAKRYPNTKHILIFDTLTLGFEAKSSEEKFLEESKRIVETMLIVNPNIKIGFEIIGLSSDLALKINTELEEKYTNNI